MRSQIIAPQPLGPIGRQHGMGRAGHAVLVHPAAWHENPADNVSLFAGSGDDELVVPEPFQTPDVGGKAAYCRFVFIEIDVVAELRVIDFQRLGPEQPDRLGVFGGGVLHGRNRGERQFVTPTEFGACLCDFKHARLARPEGNLLASVPRQQNVPAGERRMAAQRNLVGRRAPAQLPIGLA